MAALSLKHFDALEFVKKSKELGVSEPVAEYQARQFEQVIEIAVNAAKTTINDKELATKQNLELALKQLELNLTIALKEQELRLVKWVIGMGGSAIIIISGMMFTMLKLMLT